MMAAPPVSMNPPVEEHPYHPKDAINSAGISAAVTGTAGLFAAALRSARARTNVGAFAPFTRFGGTIAVWAAVGGVYQFSHDAAANLREKDDHYNTAIGGFLAGSIIGLQKRRMAPILGYGAMVSVILAAFDYSGQSLKGSRRSQELDEFDRKEYMRKNRRRPLEETLAEVGEGRSIRPPGYEERRRQRLKETYGFEVNPVSADPNA